MVNRSCVTCGIEFGVPDLYEKARCEHGGDFFCPNGHAQHFKRVTYEVLITENTFLTEENEDLRDRVVSLTARIDQLEAAVAYKSGA